MSNKNMPDCPASFEKISDFNAHVRSDIRFLERTATDLLVGKRIRILVNYNGQPYGSSKKSLKGKVLVVRWATINREGVYVLPDHPNVSDLLGFGQWELVDDELNKQPGGEV